MRSRIQDRGPGARKIKLEKRLDANAELERRNFSRKALDEDAAREADTLGGQQATPRGQKGQLAQPHRSGRPSGGNIRNRE